MSETDPGPLPASKMELAVLIINGSPIYAKSPVLSRRLPDLSSTFTYHLYYPHYCYPGKSPALAIILLSLLSLFAFKSGKICTHNSIDSFFIISSSVVCSEFNHSPFHRRMDRGEQGTLLPSSTLYPSLPRKKKLSFFWKKLDVIKSHTFYLYMTHSSK